MLRLPTLLSMLSWLPVVAVSLMPDHSQSSRVYVSVTLLVLLLTMAWHFIDVRHWRAFTRGQAVVWCVWSVALLAFGTLLLVPAF